MQLNQVFTQVERYLDKVLRGNKTNAMTIATNVRKVFQKPKAVKRSTLGIRLTDSSLYYSHDPHDYPPSPPKSLPH